MRRIYILSVILTMVLVLIIAGRLYTSNADFNPGNLYENGYSKFYAGEDIRVLYHLNNLPAAEKTDTTLLIVNPIYKYRTDDAAMIASYMNSGGNVVIIDDFGESNSLLDSLGTNIRVPRIPLCQYDNYYNGYASPVVNNISSAGLTAGVRQLYMDHPSALKSYNNSTVLAYSSNKSWLDNNGNNKADLDEKYGVFPVIAQEQYGQGTLTVIADPDLFTNEMIRLGDNSKFAANIFKGKIVYLDLSHNTGMPMLMSAVETVKMSRTAQILLITVIVLISFVGFVSVRCFFPDRSDNSFEGDLEITPDEQ